MAIRIRLNGEIFCAALSQEKEGDCYIDDQTHYELSVVNKLLVTTNNEFHMNNGGQWWWKGQQPKDVAIDKFYLE